MWWPSISSSPLFNTISSPSTKWEALTLNSKLWSWISSYHQAIRPWWAPSNWALIKEMLLLKASTRQSSFWMPPMLFLRNSTCSWRSNRSRSLFAISKPFVTCILITLGATSLNRMMLRWWRPRLLCLPSPQCNSTSIRALRHPLYFHRWLHPTTKMSPRSMRARSARLRQPNPNQECKPGIKVKIKRR